MVCRKNGVLSVMRMKDHGRWSQNLQINGHRDKGKLNDFDWNPFNEEIIATGSDDKTV